MRVIAIVGAVGVVPFASLWFVGSSLANRTAAKSALPVVEPVAPVLSARRAPETLAADVAVRNLDARLDGLEETLPSGSCLRVDAGGRTATAVRAAETLEPASNAKIITAAVVLETLPPETVFTTRVLGIHEGGVVAGNLVLKGGGDPLLVTKDYLPLEKYPKSTPTLLDTLADQLVALGITRITGAVVADETYLDNTRYMKGWGSGIRATEGGPLGALMVNDGVVVGEPMKPDNPAIAAAQEFSRLLRARGVDIAGEPRMANGADATLPELSAVNSAPLRDVLAEMLTNSNNNSAELLLRHVGLASRQTPTSAAGLEVAAELLAKWGYPDTVVQDGSGLSRGSEIACSTLVAFLENAPADSVLRTGLALAGRTGTLTDTFVGSPIEGRFRGKTGTLTNVKTLSGYLPVENTDDAVFSALMLNGTGLADQGNYRPLWDRLARAIATYPEGPDSASMSVAALAAP
jgi:D-alanyl-D-alanine carboxypeptidase/D-alanyl-D-alanine-endopeptidase (penicillin-binding protein 4)